METSTEPHQTYAVLCSKIKFHTKALCSILNVSPWYLNLSKSSSFSVSTNTCTKIHNHITKKNAKHQSTLSWFHSRALVILRYLHLAFWCCHLPCGVVICISTDHLSGDLPVVIFHFSLPFVSFLFPPEFHFLSLATTIL